MYGAYGNPRIYPNQSGEEFRKRDPEIPGKLNEILNDPDTTEGDKQFAKSLSEFWEKKGYITDRQFNYMNVIVNKKSYRAIDDEFRNNFTDEQRRILGIVANYYNLLGQYYIDIARKAIADPNWIPTKKQYEAMCCNKYALSIVENYDSEPKFDKGTLVTVRDTYRGHVIEHGKCIMIVEATDIVGPAKGSRMYRAIQIGCENIFTIQEKDVKMYRR